MDNGDNYDVVSGKIKIEKSWDAYLKSNITRIDDEKFRCAICTKLFSGETFVMKHINLKHPEKTEEVKAQVRLHFPH